MILLDRNTKMFIFGILALLGFVFAFVMSIVPHNYFYVSFILSLFSLLFSVLAFSVRYYDYLFFPLLHMKKRTAVLNNDDPYYIAPNGNAIVVRGEQLVYASSFIKIPVYVSASEMQQQEKLDFAVNFSRLAALSKTPAKLSSQLYIINKDEYMRRISDKLGQVQDIYNQLIAQPDTPTSKAERIKGEVTMWHNLYDNVSRARSQTLAAYAMVTAAGNTEEEAVNLAVVKGEDLAAGISSLLGITATLAHGDEILVFIEADKMIPSKSIEEMMQYKAAEKLNTV